MLFKCSVENICTYVAFPQGLPKNRRTLQDAAGHAAGPYKPPQTAVFACR